MQDPPKITPFLWFDGKAEEAMQFYCSVFPDAKVIKSDGMSATFELAGQRFTAFNGGPHFTFNEAISFFVRCKDQREVDGLWAKLTADGGAASRCGWLKDKYGLSWQIVPDRLGELLADQDEEKASRVMEAMFKMSKLDIAKLEAAYAGKGTD